MDELIKSILDNIQGRYTMSVILNMLSLVFVTYILYTALKTMKSDAIRKALRIIVVVISLITLVLQLQSIFDISYVIQTLKTVYETLTYNTGLKSV